MNASITAASLRQSLAANNAPLVIDVRRQPAFLESPVMLDGALRRDPERVSEWAQTLPSAERFVVYCVHGHQVSQGVAQALGAAGVRAQFLEGGIEHWRAEGGAMFAKPAHAATRWVTRERPKIDRIACPWLIARFVDPGAEFLYVPSAAVKRVAAEREAVPYDIPDVPFSHVGEQCSFDAFLTRYHLSDPALIELATIVRGADTDRTHLAPQAAGLLAISLGLSRLYTDDAAMLAQGMIMYDALYAWCREGKSEVHTWNPEAYR